MDTEIWAHITEAEYRDFWVTPQSSSPTSPPFSKTTGTLVFLLTLDSLPRKVTLLHVGPNVPAASSGPAAEKSDENDEFDGMRMSIVGSKVSIPSALHFVSLFWEFDPLAPELKSATDVWSGLVAKFPRPDDVRWAVTTETLPALLLGNPNDPFWNLAEMCIGEKPRPFSLMLLKTLLKRRTWDHLKCGKDIMDMFVNRSYSSLLNLILLLKCSRDTSEVVKKFIGLLDQTCFSGACGRSIEKLHRFLNKELLSPGYHYRKSILLQAYMLHPETAHVRAPILIVSKQSLASNKFISMARFWKNNLVSKPQILASLLSSCISNELGVPSSLLGLNYLTADDLEKHFVSATKIYEKSLRMQSAEEAEEFRQRSFERLHALLIRDMKPVEQGPPCKLVPSTPVFGFNVFTDEPPKAGEMPSVGTPLNVPYSGAMRQLFREIVVKCRERMLEAGGRAVPRVKMGIIGGDKLLQLVAGTLIFVCKEIQLSAENIPIDFYLVPVEESSFGQEFSRVDPWFRTHVCEALQYAAAVSPPFLFAKEVQQTLRHYDEFELRNQQQKRERRVLQESLVEECSGPATPNPPALVERVLTGLFEDARVSFRLPISLCLCWQMEGRFTVSFPFFTECRVFPQDRRAQHSFAVALSYHLKHIDGNVSDLVSVSRSVTSIRILQRWDLQDCLELVMKPSSTDLLASAGNGTSVGGNGGGGNGTVMASAGAGTGGSGGSGSGSGSGNGGSGNGVGGPGGVGSSSGASSLSSSVGSMSSSGAALAGMSAAAAAGGGGGGSGSGSGGNGGGGGSVGANGDIGLGGAGSLFKAEITAIDIKLDGPPGKPLVVVLDKHQYGPFLKVRCIQTQYSLPCKKFVEFS